MPRAVGFAVGAKASEISVLRRRYEPPAGRKTISVWRLTSKIERVASALRMRGWRSSRMRSIVRLNPELVHPIFENTPRRAEQLGGARLIELDVLKRRADDLALELVDGVRQ